MNKKPKNKANQIEEDCVQIKDAGKYKVLLLDVHQEQCANHRKNILDDDTNQL
jgi:hypothetical protein